MALQCLERRLPPLWRTFIDIPPSVGTARKRWHSHGGYTPHSTSNSVASCFPEEAEEKEKECMTLSTDASSTLQGMWEDEVPPFFPEARPTMQQDAAYDHKEEDTMSPANCSEGGRLHLMLEGQPSIQRDATFPTEHANTAAAHDAFSFKEENDQPPAYCSEGGRLHLMLEGQPAIQRDATFPTEHANTAAAHDAFSFKEENDLPPAYCSEGGYLHQMPEEEDEDPPTYSSEGGYLHLMPEEEDEDPPTYSSEGGYLHRMPAEEDAPPPTYSSEGGMQRLFAGRAAQTGPAASRTGLLLFSGATSVHELLASAAGRLPSRKPRPTLRPGRSHPVGAAPPQPSSRRHSAAGQPVGSMPGTGSLRYNAFADGIFDAKMTTVMIRNLPRTIKQQDLLEELDSSNFAGLYDFVYMPCSFQSGEGKGFAFVNFNAPEVVCSFVSSWNRTRRMGMTMRDPPLDISPAEIQGLEANLARWSGPRMRRIRNPNLRPFTAAPQFPADAAGPSLRFRAEERMPVKPGMPCTAASPKKEAHPAAAALLLATALAPQGLPPPPQQQPLRAEWPVPGQRPRGLVLERREGFTGSCTAMPCFSGSSTAMLDV